MSEFAAALERTPLYDEYEACLVESPYEDDPECVALLDRCIWFALGRDLPTIVAATRLEHHLRTLDPPEQSTLVAALLRERDGDQVSRTAIYGVAAMLRLVEINLPERELLQSLSSRVSAEGSMALQATLTARARAQASPQVTERMRGVALDADADDRLRDRAIRALGHWTRSEELESVIQGSTDAGSDAFREPLAEALVAVNSEGTLIAALGNPITRVSAMRALLRISSPVPSARAALEIAVAEADLSPDELELAHRVLN